MVTILSSNNSSHDLACLDKNIITELADFVQTWRSSKIPTPLAVRKENAVNMGEVLLKSGTGGHDESTGQDNTHYFDRSTGVGLGNRAFAMNTVVATIA